MTFATGEGHFEGQAAGWLICVAASDGRVCPSAVVRRRSRGHEFARSRMCAVAEKAAVDLARRLVRLGSAVRAGLLVDTGVLGEQAARGFTLAADLAEGYRWACGSTTARLTASWAGPFATAADGGETELTAALVRAATGEITGVRELATAEAVAAARDSVSAVTARDDRGAPAPDGCASTQSA
jgi:hypothetical protein